MCDSRSNHNVKLIMLLTGQYKITNLLCSWSKYKIWILLFFRYHKCGSRKLNAWRWCISRMVYFWPAHRKLRCIYRHALRYIQMYTNRPGKITPCTSKVTPLYLLGEPASLLVVTNPHPPSSLVCQQLSHPLALTPLTLSHPTVHITLFT